MILLTGCATVPDYRLPDARQQKEFFAWPLNGEIISYFGQKSYGTGNKGIDIKASAGVSVLASKGGRVIYCSDNLKGHGHTIIIDHKDGFSTIYSRGSKNLVKAGDVVSQNQVIALAGSTGRGSGTYLHFEIRKEGKPQNPIYYLP